MKGIIINLLLILLLSVSSISLLAQEVTFERRNFKNDKEGFETAEGHLKAGNHLMMARPTPDYKGALKHFLIAQNFNSKSAYLNYNIGMCYLNTPQKFKAIDYFQNAYELNRGLYSDIHYFLGRGHHLKMEWQHAIYNYKKHKNKLDATRDLGAIADLEKKIFECQSGIELSKNPVRVWIENLGENINSEYSEYGMIITANASEMYFTSYRPVENEGKKKGLSENYYEQVYTSNRYKTTDWTKAEAMGPPINIYGHNAAVALNPDGSKMIVYFDDGGDGNLYESVRDGDTWSKPVMFNEEISGKYHESSAWYSPDGKQLYFVSERPLKKGGPPKDKDIYVATWDEDKKDWGNVVRLPETINSKYDDDGIFVHPNGKTIYFSSKGHNSMGGYDIFKSVKQDDGTWLEPINVGYPLNTPDDDVFLVVEADGRVAYMTSYREDGFGEKDLYRVTLLGAKKDPILNGENMLLANSTVGVRAVHIEPKVKVYSNDLMILRGVIRDEESKLPIQANIELIDNETNTIIGEFTSDSKTGRYLVSIPAGKNYGIVVKRKDYLFHSENFDMKKNSGFKEVELNIHLQMISVGKAIVLRNIFFDLDKTSFRQESKYELNRVVELLTENPSMKIEIAGHTDSRGTDAYNEQLSKNRAKSIVDYLVIKGIDESRLTSVGYGEGQLIKTDAEISKMSRYSDKQAAHQQNRRTEIKVLSK